MTAVPASVKQAHKHGETAPLPAYSVHMDACRAIAAFLVFAGHARLLFFGEHGGRGAAATAVGSEAGAHGNGLGHQAVIVFFVLSGYLVGGSAWRAIRERRWSWHSYLLQRLTRLWIVLIPALLIGGALDHIGLHIFPPGSIYTGPPGQSMVTASLPARAGASALLGNLFFLQDILTPTYGTNDPLWSLANEFWYYLAFPSFLLALLPGRPLLRRLSYLALGAAMLLFAGRSISALFPVWLLGFAVALLPLAAVRRRRMGFALGFLQFAAANVLARTHALPLSIGDQLLGLSFAVFLYCLLQARAPVRSMLYQRAAVRLASFSYTLYVVHLPFLAFVCACALEPWRPWAKNPAHYALFLLVAMAVYGYAFLLYLAFESRTDKVRRSIVAGLKREPAKAKLAV